MALSRQLLKSMGLTPEQEDAIINEHIAPVNALQSEVEDLKTQLKQYKEKYSDYEAVVKERDTLTSTVKDWEDRYNGITAEYNSYKTGIENENVRREKTAKYSALLRTAGIDPDYIDTIMEATNIDKVDIDNTTVESIKESKWGKLISSTATVGVNTVTPPDNNADVGMTVAQFNRLGYLDKLKLKQEQPDVYEALANA